MTTRISSGGPSNYVTALPTASRTTATPTRPFQQMVAAGSRAIVASAEQAATRLPGGAIIAAAVRPGPANVSAASSPEGASSALGAAGGAGNVGQGPGGMEGVLSQSADQNLYFLELQERISQESRNYTTLSNVLKARHETVKNAIGNIR